MNFSHFLDFLFPNPCFGCGTTLEGGAVVCTHCEYRIPLHRTLFCSVCGAPLPRPDHTCHTGSLYRVAAATTYDNEVIRQLVRSLKFEGIQQAAIPLSTLLIRYVETLAMDFGNPLVVPIPLHREREKVRGFNQTAIIGRLFAHHFQFEFLEHALKRTRATPPQSELDRVVRLKNLNGCFAVADPRAVLDRVVLVVDDVITSGATLNEAANTLMRSGARSVVGVVVAKA